MKRGLTLLFAPALIVAILLFASGAAGDGAAGPWADSVYASNQGLTKAGNPVPADRSDPTSALGPVELDGAIGSFYSLGLGGWIKLKFDNYICNGDGPDLEVFEVTWGEYHLEGAKVFAGQTAANLVLASDTASNATAIVGYPNVRSSLIDLPDGMPWAKFVRLDDVTAPPSSESGIADGFDLTAVRALHSSDSPCGTQGRILAGRMTGGGTIGGVSASATHGFELQCDVGRGPNSLELNWGRGNRFHLGTLTAATCTDDPAIAPTPPPAGFDTYRGAGTGRFNGEPNATAEWVFTDAGEPGRNDLASIVIRNAAGNVVFSDGGALQKGNHQAHKQ